MKTPMAGHTTSRVEVLFVVADGWLQHKAKEGEREKGETARDVNERKGGDVSQT